MQLRKDVLDPLATLMQGFHDDRSLKFNVPTLPSPSPIPKQKEKDLTYWPVGVAAASECMSMRHPVSRAANRAF
jgi:hypothetical protein